MASVDLMGGDAQRIRNRYQTSLQRSASDDEVSGWLSGSYGGGGIDQWENQIAQSDEARQRGTWRPTETRPDQPTDDRRDERPPADRPPPPVIGQPGPNNTMPPPAPTNTQGQTPYKNIDWWGAQGVPASEIFNLDTGQLKPGWKHTINGYERTTTTTTTSSPWDVDPRGNYSNWFLQNTAGMAPSGRALEGLAPYLSKFGIKLGGRNAQGMIDTIITPDGRAWDVIESATLDGGKRWQWIPAGGSGGPTGGPTGGRTTTGNTGVGGGQLPGNQYNDPYSVLLENLITSRIGALQSPYEDFYRKQYEQGLQDRAASLGSANTQVTQLMDYLQKRFTELQGPGYTGAENEVLRTQALDPVETDRAAARQRVLERLSARGLTPDSGIAQQALLEVDKAFDAMRATNQGTLASNELARREDRAQRAQTIGGQLVDIPDQRSREQLDVFSALELLSATARSEDEARSREAISYAGSLNDMTMQRLQAAMQAAGLGGNPASLLSGLTGIAGLNQNAAALNRANSASKWSGLGSIMAILAASR